MPFSKHEADSTRLSEQVETLLKSQDSNPAVPEATPNLAVPPVQGTDFNMLNPTLGITPDLGSDRWRLHGDSPQQPMNDLNFATNMNLDLELGDNSFTWEMISLGVEEPLPPQDTIDALYVAH